MTFTKGYTPWNKNKTNVQIPWNKNKTNVYSKETLQKMSESQKGKIPWNKGKHWDIETIEKIRLSNLGQTRSEQTKERMSKSKKGKTSWRKGLKGIVSKETKEKMSEAISAEKHPNWKGGISCEPYCDVWLDKNFKDSIKKRDDYTCQNCSNIKNLCIHHINYIKKDYNPNNLITLCISCNSKANFDRNIWESFYSNLMDLKNI